MIFLKAILLGKDAFLVIQSFILIFYLFLHFNLMLSA